jgi:hypothetical protein
MAAVFQLCDELARPIELFAFVAQRSELLCGRLSQVVADASFDDCPGNCLDELVTAHADVAVNPPQRQDDLVPPECAMPGDRVLVVGVDERAIEVEQRRRRAQDTTFVFSRCAA